MIFPTHVPLSTFGKTQWRSVSCHLNIGCFVISIFEIDVSFPFKIFTQILQEEVSPITD